MEKGVCLVMIYLYFIFKLLYSLYDIFQEVIFYGLVEFRFGYYSQFQVDQVFFFKRTLQMRIFLLVKNMYVC